MEATWVEVTGIEGLVCSHCVAWSVLSNSLGVGGFCFLLSTEISEDLNIDTSERLRNLKHSMLQITGIWEYGWERKVGQQIVTEDIRPLGISSVCSQVMLSCRCVAYISNVIVSLNKNTNKRGRRDSTVGNIGREPLQVDEEEALGWLLCRKLRWQSVQSL